MKHPELPPEDRVKVKRNRFRGKSQIKNAAILKALSLIHWDLVVEGGSALVKLAIDEAREHGRYWYSTTPRGDGGLVDYCEYVVSAAKHIKIINDVEWKLWFSNPKDDPRLLEFRRGFLESKKEAEKAKKNPRRRG